MWENVTCKRDPEARDRDVWLSVRDETETETFPHFTKTETRPRRWENASRDRDVETETTSLIQVQVKYSDLNLKQLNILNTKSQKYH